MTQLGLLVHSLHVLVAATRENRFWQRLQPLHGLSLSWTLAQLGGATHCKGVGPTNKRMMHKTEGITVWRQRKLARVYIATACCGSCWTAAWGCRPSAAQEQRHLNTASSFIVAPETLGASLAGACAQAAGARGGCSGKHRALQVPIENRALQHRWDARQAA